MNGICEYCFESKTIHYSNRHPAWVCFNCYQKSMPIFQDTKEPTFFVPKGDYIFCAVEMTHKISQGVKTAGSPQYEFKMEIEGKNCHFYELLTEHDSIMWKLESFIRATGVVLQKGQGWSFVKSEADAHPGWLWINPLGLRGHVLLTEQEYPAGSKKMQNKAAVYYAPDAKHPKLEPRVIEAEEEKCPF